MRRGHCQEEGVIRKEDVGLDINDVPDDNVMKTSVMKDDADLSNNY